MRITPLNIIIILLLFPFYSYSFQAENTITDELQEERAKNLFKQFRCVVCAGQSIAESDVELARDLRTKIRDKIKNGETDQQIIKSIAELYGREILFKPPIETETYILWFGPFIFIFIGAVAIWIFSGKKKVTDK